MMNDEQRAKLYREASENSKRRLDKEKLEKARKRSVESAITYCHFKKLNDEVEKERRKLLSVLRESRDFYRERLKIFRKWRQDLEKRFLTVELEPWQVFLNRNMAEALDKKIPQYEECLQKVEQEIILKRRRQQ